MTDISGKQTNAIDQHQKVTKQKQYNHTSSNKLQMVNTPTGVKGYQVNPTFDINTKNWPNQEKNKYDVPHAKEQQINIRIRKPLLKKVDSEPNIGGYFFTCFRTFLNNLLPFNI